MYGNVDVKEIEALPDWMGYKSCIYGAFGWINRTHDWSTILKPNAKQKEMSTARKPNANYKEQSTKQDGSKKQKEGERRGLLSYLSWPHYAAVCMHGCMQRRIEECVQACTHADGDTRRRILFAPVSDTTAQCTLAKVCVDIESFFQRIPFIQNIFVFLIPRHHCNCQGEHRWQLREILQGEILRHGLLAGVTSRSRHFV